MSRRTFFCIDAHPAGNPVRVVVGGAPPLTGATISDRRQHFIRDYDWICAPVSCSSPFGIERFQ